MDLENLKKMNDAIFNDEELKQCYIQKSRILNSMMPKYIWDTKNNTLTGTYDAKSINALEKIEEMIKYRVDFFKGIYL